MPALPNRHRVALDALLEKADTQGYLTADDLMEIYPEASDSDRLSATLTSLRQRGVELLDADDSDDREADTPSRAFPPYETFSGDDPVSLYLREMARVPLLNMKEELDLAIRIDKGRKARKKLASLPHHSTARRHRLDALIHDGDEAREHLIKANTRLVVSIAKRFIGRGVHLLDLIQEGNLGLMKAVEKFDHKRGFRFSTYATWWIRQTITRAIADQARTIRIPVHMSDRIRELHKAQQELEQSLGRQPNVEELAEAIHLPVRKTQWILRVSWQPISLESPVGGDDETELGQFIEDEVNPTPVQAIYLSMLKDKLSEALDDLSPREARVLRLRFGLDDGNAYTLEEVGQKFGLTRERIRQIEGSALKRLRHPKRSHRLKDYL